MNILMMTYPLNAALMFAIALSWGVVLTRCYRLGWRLWWLGAAAFFLSQVVHLPVLWLVNRLGYHGAPPSTWQSSPAAFARYALVLGVLAGLSEELLRYAVLRWWAKEARSWRQALLFGAGHGGLEAIILGALVLANFFSMFALRGKDLSLLVPAEQLPLAQAQVQAFWGVDWWLPLLGAWERFWTLPVHIFLAVLVMRSFTRRNGGYLLAAIGWHTLVDAGAVMVVSIWGVLPTEGVVTLMGAVSLWGIFALRETDPPETESVFDEAAPPKRESPPLPPLEVDAQSLDSSRYEAES
ncbi:MAG: YhfC family intramembrane metalloprotease [Anaerolineales bacterium]